MDLIFASQNQGKIEEIKAILTSVNVLSLYDLKETVEVEETGQTFKDNAFLKANYYFQKYKLPTFADDSGLIVPSLNGEPGVKSARYASEKATYQENNALLLQRMKHMTNRKAEFISTICYINKKGMARYFEGHLHGEIALEAKGENGFGYDPIFLIPVLNKTLGELPNEVKNHLSHRFYALKEFMNYLQKEVK